MGSAAATSKLGYGFPTPGPQSPTGQKVMDHVFFLSQEEWKRAREEGRYDLIIVGTGFCGLATAHRALERDPHCRILLLERGIFFLPEHFQDLPGPYTETLGGLSETFPWTLSAVTAQGQRGGSIRWQHGMVPFFGGRSTLWSAWCPRPTDEEMAGWPEETIGAARRNFEAAEKLLHVQPADQVDPPRASEVPQRIRDQRPVYGALQRVVQKRLEKARGMEGIYRTEPAPLASDAKSVNGTDFAKYATPAELLDLVVCQRELAAKGEGAPLHIATECVVERLVEQGGTVTALETSQGVLPLGSAHLVLAMGTLPPTTLVRNTFPESRAGERFSAHFISSIIARVPRSSLDPHHEFGELEIGACYVAGIKGSYEQQFHIQLSALSDQNPQENAGRALRYMPDVVATASPAQLETSEDHVIFVCAVLGELDWDNADTWFRGNPSDRDPTTNSLLQVVETARDAETWDAMEQATFAVLERCLSPKGPEELEYWHGAPDEGTWQRERPPLEQRRVDALVHESSTLHLGAEEEAPVDLSYRLRGAENLYVTGGGLWPQGGSWNPTLTMVALALDLADRLVPRALEEPSAE